MTVQSARGSYEITRIEKSSLFSIFPAESFIVTDEIVAELHLRQGLGSASVLVLPSGEATKSLQYFGECLQWLARSGAHRRSTLVAFGGGVVGDLVGFVASAYMRGIPYLQVPTTLLAQVDSSVGGKVAIDLPEGKNLAGAFYPPNRVLISGEILRSLPERQVRNGFAEVVKYGLISDSTLLRKVDYRKYGDLDEIVDECIRIKAEIVEADEFETTGQRAALNFGHTVAHAMESVLNYSELLHGEAVSIGMLVEARLAAIIGFSAKGVTEEVEAALKRASLPTTHSILSQADALVGAMYRDKKSTKSKLGFSLLKKVGECKLVTDVSESDLRLALVA
jgi:3-dehydroquinate synthase